MKSLNYFCMLLLWLAATVGPLSAAEPIFVPVKIDGPVHDPANDTYWFGPFSECCSVLDIDGDGDLDIAAGRNWYEAPRWRKHENFRDGAMTNGPETDNNSEFAMDINKDGRVDIASSGWMYMKGAFWYENASKTGVKWISRRIHLAKSMEGIIHGDIDGDGDDDILVNHWTLEPGQGVTWLESIGQEPRLREHIVGTKGDLHGNGLGDINSDGRTDIVTPAGWYEGPAKPTEDEWTFHDDYTWQGSASHPILIHDVDEDGLNHIIVGASHSYGLAWLEQVVDASGKRTFSTHWIEKDFGQCHTMELADLNGDGKPDLVTGKRLFAHHCNDISAFDPLFAFWYDIKGGKFERHVLSYNHLPWYPEEKTLKPPPNGAVAVGMKLNIVDLDKDGDNDIVIAGKTGLYVFFNKGYPPSPRREYKLPPHESYPSWRNWPGFKPLFNSNDLTGWKIPQGDNDHWKVVDRVIDYDAQSEARSDKSLWTEESFGDFRLLLEWRFKRTTGLYPMPTILPDGSLKTDADGKVITELRPNADSGILLRGTSKGQVNIWCWPIGSGEMWGVRNDRNLQPESRAAAVPKVRADNPVGEWNLFDITVKGDRVTVILNGQTVIDNAQVPGIAEKGPIGLQHHGGLNKKTGKMSPASSLIQFRNIWIKEIK